MGRGLGIYPNPQAGKEALTTQEAASLTAQLVKNPPEMRET